MWCARLAEPAPSEIMQTPHFQQCFASGLILLFFPPRSLGGLNRDNWSTRGGLTRRSPLHWAAVEAAGLAAALDALDRSVVIHGVLVGDGVRENYEGLFAALDALDRGVVVHGVLMGDGLRDSYEGLPAGRVEIFAYAIVEAVI